ncbi:MAG TPA: PaaI family thioesterase [Bacteroidales bacterium]|nr:PaaI family thioesterase [Bacteroidales bacterium]
MKKIINPYINISGYNCFGCAPNNKNGLKMEFYEDREYVCCQWEPTESFQGYKGVLHGGIQQTLMDEIASWAVQLKLKTAGVTSRMNTRFTKPVLIESTPIFLKARLIAQKKQFAEIEVHLYNSKNDLCTSSVVTYFIMNEKEAVEKFFYPGIESFYDIHSV